MGKAHILSLSLSLTSGGGVARVVEVCCGWRRREEASPTGCAWSSVEASARCQGQKLWESSPHTPVEMAQQGRISSTRGGSNDELVTCGNGSRSSQGRSNPPTIQPLLLVHKHVQAPILFSTPKAATSNKLLPRPIDNRVSWAEQHKAFYFLVFLPVLVLFVRIYSLVQAVITVSPIDYHLILVVQPVKMDGLFHVIDAAALAACLRRPSWPSFTL